MNRIMLAVAITAAVLQASPGTAQNATPYAGPIIDGHAHLRTGDGDAMGPGHSLGTEGLGRLQGAAGISRSALIVIAGGGPAAVQAKNNALLQAVAANPQRYFAIASVHPADGDAAVAELDRLAAKGVRFIKLHPNSQEFDVADPAVARITAQCGKLGMTVLFDSYDPFDPGQIGKFLKLTMSQPGTRFILAHMGYVRFRETMVWSLLKERGAARNVWFDLSAIAPLYADTPMAPELAATMRKIGMDRMIFGTDWPAYDVGGAVRAARMLPLAPAEQRQLFHDNMAALLALPR
ncbi:metal-dependent hydrolase [Sphingomonas sp. IBVSS1]|nr:metal-dependent hydrolase [Sphingomonas sp. IBVSS1]